MLKVVFAIIGPFMTGALTSGTSRPLPPS